MTRVDSDLLRFADARQEACLTCHNPACCTHLVVQTMALDALADVDYALYLLGFEGIYVSLMQDVRTVNVYFHQACRHLDGAGLCSIHSTPAQPTVCKEYRSHSCGYKRIFGPELADDQPVLDAAMMALVARRMAYGEDRRIVARPAWADLITALAAMPVDRHQAPVPPGPAPAPQPLAWGRAEGPAAFDDPGVARPCDGCPAPCCHTLLFPCDPPADVRSVDFLRYMLGFPSVRLQVGQTGWQLAVTATCRHLDGTRCGLYGRPERPIRGEEYDEYRCSFKAPAEAAVTLGLEDFPRLAGLFVFDELGRVRSAPTLDTIVPAMAAGRRPPPSIREAHP